LIELVLRIGFSLLIVFGVMWGLAKVARRPLGVHRGTSNLSVLNRQQLSRGSAVAIVQVADKALVLGVTDQQVSLLGETDLATFEKHPHVVEHRDHLPLAPGTTLDGSVLSRRTWRSTMDFLRDRTTRR
jgi:flagellar protein FliO/FliZ